MKNYRKYSKTDGYIKNQYIRIKNERISVLIKISTVVVPIVLFLIFYASLVLTTPVPEKWERSEIIYSDIYNDYHMGYYSDFLNTVDEGSFVLPVGYEKIEELNRQLMPGKSYSIVYTETLFSRIINSLSDDSKEYIKMEDAVEKWKKERRELSIASAICVFLLISGIILSYTLWCKPEREQINKIKLKINTRTAKARKQN
ncbi:MAG: hypothetical protein E7535_04355 [Ruminococcaceae bacterium]|nr:hypothetical protein [Oscillospiraceae bacterium]